MEIADAEGKTMALLPLEIHDSDKEKGNVASIPLVREPQTMLKNWKCSTPLPKQSYLRQRNATILYTSQTTLHTQKLQRTPDLNVLDDERAYGSISSDIIDTGEKARLRPSNLAEYLTIRCPALTVSIDLTAQVGLHVRIEAAFCRRPKRHLLEDGTTETT
jgi:hypothetical protein